MIMPQAYHALFDVGHGNNAVLVDHDHVVVIDVDKRNTLMDYLEDQCIAKIHTIIKGIRFWKKPPAKGKLLEHDKTAHKNQHLILDYLTTSHKP